MLKHALLRAFFLSLLQLTLLISCLFGTYQLQQNTAARVVNWSQTHIKSPTLHQALSDTLTSASTPEGITAAKLTTNNMTARELLERGSLGHYETQGFGSWLASQLRQGYFHQIFWGIFFISAAYALYKGRRQARLHAEQQVILENFSTREYAQQAISPSTPWLRDLAQQIELQKASLIALSEARDEARQQHAHLLHNSQWHKLLANHLMNNANRALLVANQHGEIINFNGLAKPHAQALAKALKTQGIPFQDNCKDLPTVVLNTQHFLLSSNVIKGLYENYYLLELSLVSSEPEPSLIEADLSQWVKDSSNAILCSATNELLLASDDLLKSINAESLQAQLRGGTQKPSKMLAVGFSPALNLHHSDFKHCQLRFVEKPQAHLAGNVSPASNDAIHSQQTKLGIVAHLNHIQQLLLRCKQQHLSQQNTLENLLQLSEASLALASLQRLLDNKPEESFDIQLLSDVLFSELARSKAFSQRVNWQSDSAQSAFIDASAQALSLSLFAITLHLLNQTHATELGITTQLENDHFDIIFHHHNEQLSDTWLSSIEALGHDLNALVSYTQHKLILRFSVCSDTSHKPHMSEAKLALFAQGLIEAENAQISPLLSLKELPDTPLAEASALEPMLWQVFKREYQQVMQHLGKKSETSSWLRAGNMLLASISKFNKSKLNRAQAALQSALLQQDGDACKQAILQLSEQIDALD